MPASIRVRPPDLAPTARPTSCTDAENTAPAEMPERAFTLPVAESNINLAETGAPEAWKGKEYKPRTSVVKCRSRPPWPPAGGRVAVYAAGGPGSRWRTT